MIVEIFQLSFHVFVCAFRPEISSFFTEFPLYFPIFSNILIFSSNVFHYKMYKITGNHGYSTGELLFLTYVTMVIQVFKNI